MYMTFVCWFISNKQRYTVFLTSNVLPCTDLTKYGFKTLIILKRIVVVHKIIILKTWKSWQSLGLILCNPTASLIKLYALHKNQCFLSLLIINLHENYVSNYSIILMYYLAKSHDNLFLLNLHVFINNHFASRCQLTSAKHLR